MREMNWRADRQDKSEYHLEYDGDRDLLDYHLEDITVLSEAKYVTVTLHLTGHFDYHLLNSFAPSALMFVICYSTLFFPVTNFNERIMVSLTAMLVLAGLFAQATNNYIKTPYFKLLDIWYATLIMFCFFVVIANAVVNSLFLNTSIFYKTLIHPRHSFETEKDKVSKNALRCNTICKIVLMCLFIFLIILYELFGAGVI
ncbi:uncharacterized protein [Panulirus ornatus]|uniref:uncharacterized protein n=1 Tax=Panulirus ornatus TaxID=150431 RepID=UPI003A898DE6